MRFDELRLGQTAERTRTITMADIQAFADLTGDRSAMHFDADYAKASRFGGLIGHGLLTASLLSPLLGMQLPGKGTLYRHQSLRFRAAVFPDDTLTASAEVIELRPERMQVRLRTIITNQRGDVVLDGEAEMLMME